MEVEVVIVTKRVIFRDGDDVQLDYNYLMMQKIQDVVAVF